MNYKHKERLEKLVQGDEFLNFYYEMIGEEFRYENVRKMKLEN